ncbi:MAG: hypothetical protein HC900_00130 [Methylacidiphilales bacterium]|nr:hypothetical protein [Candidatus Methylacidiphilales bacterium]
MTKGIDAKSFAALRKGDVIAVLAVVRHDQGADGNTCSLNLTSNEYSIFMASAADIIDIVAPSLKVDDIVKDDNGASARVALTYDDGKMAVLRANGRDWVKPASALKRIPSGPSTSEIESEKPHDDIRF